MSLSFFKMIYSVPVRELDCVGRPTIIIVSITVPTYIQQGSECMQPAAVGRTLSNMLYLVLYRLRITALKDTVSNSGPTAKYSKCARCTVQFPVQSRGYTMVQCLLYSKADNQDNWKIKFNFIYFTKFFKFSYF
jgi:hypothetical protein